MTLKRLLEDRLPQGVSLQLHYLKGKAAPRTPSKKKLKQLIPETHFLAVYEADLLILALDVLVYKSADLTTLYVSKADSTGCHSRQVSLALLIECFLEQLLEQQIGQVRLTLFARAQPQYIFPSSSQNAGKHQLDDRALVQWWIGILERLRRRLKNGSGYLMVPGAESKSVERTYLNTLPVGAWKASYNGSSKTLAKDVLLNFPDDPKGRFLDQLASDKALDTTTLGEFWELMAHRQEMSSGRSIGFIELHLEVHALEQEVAAAEHDYIEVLDKKLGVLRDELEAHTYASREETFRASRHWRTVISSPAGATANPSSVFGQCQSKVGTADKEQADCAPLNGSKKRHAEITQPNVLVPRKKKACQKT